MALKRQTGFYEKLGSCDYFIPFNLPPQDPPFNLGGERAILYGSAMLRLGQLNEMAERLPDKKRFIKAYVIKEALLSSAIEGIHTTMLDVFTQPLITDKKMSKETQLVLNYTKALDTALKLVKEENLPIVSRVILAAHKELMGIDSHEADPGNYRKQAVRVGNLVPPPPLEVPKLMGELEKFINEFDELPPLIKAGLAHVQFETIHPFLDGNGRIGRLLIVLMLIDSGLIEIPILYPSYYFKRHHLEYYQRLDSVRTQGDFEGWVDFYLRAIEASSFDAYRRAKDIEQLERKIRDEIAYSPRYKKICRIAHEALSLFFQFPLISVKELSEHIGKAYNTANNLVQNFVEQKILVEVTEQKRNKLYSFAPYLALLEKEYTE